MHRLSASFVLGYHGCYAAVAELLLLGEPLIPSRNDYDWLGPGVYFWEANPLRGLQFARESSSRTGSRIDVPTVVGAVIDLGLCLDLTTAEGLRWLRTAHSSLKVSLAETGNPMPRNSSDGLRRNLDCAVISHLHEIMSHTGGAPIDTVKGIFVEGEFAYPGSGVREKTHIQIAVCNPACVRGVFRVPKAQLRGL